MARTVPGSGAIIEPHFNEDFGVAFVEVIDGGSGYDPTDPPRLVIDNCGVPIEEAVLYPFIDADSGKITYVRVLESGRGYDPLRVVITPKQDSITRINTFDPNVIWVSANTSVTTGRFTEYDRLNVRTNGLPDPAPYDVGGIYATQYNHTFIYRGGKDVPSPVRNIYEDIPIGIAPNGVEYHTPGFYSVTGAVSIPNYTYDIVKNGHLLSVDEYGGVSSEDQTLAGKYFYTSYKVNNAFDLTTSTYNIAKYYRDTNYQGDRSRHPNGHSKVLGYSYDGYPIYGPYGYSDRFVAASPRRLESSYRLKTTDEIDATRPKTVTPSTVTYTVTVAPAQTTGTGNRYYITGGGFTNAEKQFLNLERGSTYVFNQDDASNTTHAILFSIYGSSTAQGWHTPGQTPFDNNAVWQNGVSYYLDGNEVTYQTYIDAFNGASQRRVEIEVPPEAPNILYYFCYNHANMAERLVVDGYTAGTFIEDNIFEDGLGDLDQYNGRYGVTPEYPNGTYAYFMTIDGSGNPQYPYIIGRSFFGTEYLPGPGGAVLPDVSLESPRGAFAEAILADDGSGEISYVKMKSNGDGYFGESRVEILGGEGSGAIGSAVTQTVTGLSLLQAGRDYASPPSLFFQGGGGSGATGVAYIDVAGTVTDISIVNGGQFYQEVPYVLIDGGGGIGAKAEAVISQGQVTDIVITEPGIGYTSSPNVIFTKLAVLKRQVRNRQAYNSVNFYLTGLAHPLGPADDQMFVDSTDAYPGSGTLMLGNEIIRYTSKSNGRFTGLLRGQNFRFDQRVILDAGQNDPNTGISTYNFKVGDRVIRQVENASNKIAIVYDWIPSTRELFVKFEVDDLAFIDAGIPTSEELVVAFDGGVAESSLSAQLPHVIESAPGETIPLILGDPVYSTKITPPTVLQDVRYVDADENGIPDLDNTGTQFANQISLDGGIYNSLYGIEETVGGQNTTLFQLGDGIQDSSIPVKNATVDVAGNLDEGVDHEADVTLVLDVRYTNNQNFFPGEIITAQQSGITGEVVFWNLAARELTLTNVTEYNTGNVALGVNGKFYTFSKRGSIVDMKVISPGNNYTAVPTITIESSVIGVDAVATAVMSVDGDQIESVTMNTEGYGYVQSVDISNNLHPTVTVTNDPGDTTGNGAVLEAILGGEEIIGNNGARWRIKDIKYSSLVRNEFSS